MSLIERRGKVTEVNLGSTPQDGTFQIVHILYLWLPRRFVVEVSLTRRKA